MSLQFAHGWVLFMVWAIPVLAFLWFLLFRRKQKALALFLAEPMLSKLSPAVNSSRFYWQAACIQAGLILLLIAAARPQWGMEERTVFQRGRDLIIALDVSRSMLARDVHPSRLQRAKTDIQDLLRELRGDRVALLVFRGLAVQLCPLTTDYAYLAQILDDVTVDSAPPGETNIGDAIEKALAAFENDLGAHRAMILISDGEDLAGRAKTAAELAKTKGVVVFAIGLGDPQGARIPGASKSEPHLVYQGQEVISRLQHETLKEIAGITGGAYVPVGLANVNLGKLYSEYLSKITARDIEESLQKRMLDRYQWFLFPGVLLLLAGALLSRGRLAARGRSAHAPRDHAKTFFPYLRAAKLILLFFVLHACRDNLAAAPGQPITVVSPGKTVSAPGLPPGAATSGAPPAGTAEGEVADKTDVPERQAAANAVAAKPALPENFPTGRQGASMAQGLYRRGDYRRAASAYLHAMSNSSPHLQNNCLFNGGCAFYRAGDYSNAARSFALLGGREDVDHEKTAYNLGAANYRLAEQADAAQKTSLLEKAGGAFQRALRAGRDASRPRKIHGNAAANLAVITNLLPKAREEAKLQALMAAYGRHPPGQLADMILQKQREIIAALPPAVTNAAPGRIPQFEALAERQRANSDLMIPFQAALSQAVAAQGPQGGQQTALLGQHLEALRNSMHESYNYLRDVDNRALSPARAAEHGVYNLWKKLAPFEKLLQEDIRRQTNAIAMTTSLMAEAAGEIKLVQTEQNEARDLTGLFAERFAQAVPSEGISPDKKLPGMPAAPLADPENTPPSTNDAARITPEMRTNILFLAEQALQKQAKSARFLAA
ncbi:MAG: VWA domain-containing protein, partial [Kiritimatiellae bacterium]|nr:VWA domain-containing protein [Kiritimatiellia bacterium]